MSAQRIGASQPVKDLPLSRLSDWVTVWGAPVWHGPRAQAIVAYLKAEGYPARVQGHFIQTFPDDVAHVRSVIENWGKDTYSD